MSNLFAAKVTISIQRSQQNEIRLAEAKQRLQQVEVMRGIAMYRNQRTELQAQIPQLEINYIESLKDILYELNGYSLYCLALAQFGAPCTPQETTEITNVFLQIGFKLLSLNKREDIKRSLAKSDREFKGVYDFEEIHEKTPEAHAEESLALLDQYKQEQDRLAEEERARRELQARVESGELNIGMANQASNLSANVARNAVANARANVVANAVANARANVVANALVNARVNAVANAVANAPAEGKGKEKGKGRGRGKAK
jgi:hypothetical protein